MIIECKREKSQGDEQYLECWYAYCAHFRFEVKWRDCIDGSGHVNSNSSYNNGHFTESALLLGRNTDETEKSDDDDDEEEEA